MKKMIIISRITLGETLQVRAIEVQLEVAEPINKTKHMENIEVMSTIEKYRNSREIADTEVIKIKIRLQIHSIGIISPEDIKMIIQMKINEWE